MIDFEISVLIDRSILEIFGFFKVAEALLASQVRGQMEGNLIKLKSVLEAGA